MDLSDLIYSYLMFQNFPLSGISDYCYFNIIIYISMLPTFSSNTKSSPFLGMCRIVILPDTGYPVTVECRIPHIRFVLNTGYLAGYPTIKDK